MKHPTRTTIAVAVVAAVALTSAACSGSSGGTTSTSAASNGATASGSATAADGAGKTLKLWHYEGATSAMGIAWDKAIEIFKAEHPGVTVTFERKAFEQIQQNASMILSSDQAPDVMEYNKGNATAGLLSSKGMLTDLTEQATTRGWDKTLSPSLQTTAKYTEKGVMGGDSWFGVPNYGEYVTVYYNKDTFKKLGVNPPTTVEEMTALMDKFVAAKQTPIGMAGAEYPAGQLFYQLALEKADRTWIDNYQMYKGDVSFTDGAIQYGADTFADWVKKGYVSSKSASIKAEDMGTAFIAGKSPMIVSGTWWYGRFQKEIKGFDWGTFRFPGTKFALGSSGNLWVVPEQAKNKDLAYDFIDVTMRPEVQNLLGQNGGVPVKADASAITDPKNKELVDGFNKLLADDGLAFYPDWPVPGYYDVLVAGFQALINGTKSSEQVRKDIQAPYVSGVAEVKNG